MFPCVIGTFDIVAFTLQNKSPLQYGQSLFLIIILSLSQNLFEFTRAAQLLERRFEGDLCFDSTEPSASMAFYFFFFLVAWSVQGIDDYPCAFAPLAGRSFKYVVHCYLHLIAGGDFPPALFSRRFSLLLYIPFQIAILAFGYSFLAKACAE